MDNSYAASGAHAAPDTVGTLGNDASTGGQGRTGARSRAHRAPSAQSARLRDAFLVFTEAARRLEDTYASLHRQVGELSEELARANAELTRQLEDRQALVERQAALLAALPAGVVVVDAGGVVREANAAAGTLLGVPVIGHAWSGVAQRLAPAGADFEWLTRTGEPRRLNVQDQRLGASGERIVLLHDITEAHAARAARERNERLASMGEMAARMAHQLRTPLSTAMLYASQLERQGVGAPERARLGEKILARLRSLERVTRDMLRFVRGEQAPEQPIEVSVLLREATDVAEPLLQSKGIGFACEDHTAHAILLGDRRGLGAALLSLLENAAQATAQGGKVRLAAMANSRHVRIQVCDSGAGIAPSALPHLFEPFFSTRSEGTGLGLAIVKGVVEAHGGSIDVQSEPGCGTIFTLTLPCATLAPEQCARAPARPALEYGPIALEREAA